MNTTLFRHLPYPTNLWSTVTGQRHLPSSLPLDWENTWENLLATVGSDRRKEMVRLYFKEQLTLDTIGETFGVCREYVRQEINKAIRRLQTPVKMYTMECGLERAEYMQQNHLGYWTMESHPETGDETPLLCSHCVSDLDLTSRTHNRIRRAGIHTIGQLIALTEPELFQISRLGQKGIQEIKDCLEKCNLHLAHPAPSEAEQ